jgi:hypothetical protein
MSSPFGGEGTGSAALETGTARRATDGCADARELRRQQARRGDARGTGPDYDGVTFGAGRRWVSR